MATGAGSSGAHPNAGGAHNDTPMIHPSNSLNIPAATTDNPAAATKKKRKNHRGGRGKKNKKQQDSSREDAIERSRPSQGGGDRPSFYRSWQSNLSGTSLDSDVLLDHREHQPLRPRRDSRAAQNLSNTMSSSFFRRRGSRPADGPEGDDDAEEEDDRTPLLGASHSPKVGRSGHSYGGVRSRQSSTSNRGTNIKPAVSQQGHSYGINNPPSVPASPVLGADTGFGDVLEGEFTADDRRHGRHNDFVIDIDQAGDDEHANMSPSASRGLERRHTLAGTGTAEADVCFPQGDMSEIASEAVDFDYMTTTGEDQDDRPRARRRRRRWPDLEELDIWATEEKEQRSEGLRARKVREPQYVGGRLRPKRSTWHREPDDAPYRFTYFNEMFDETIHARTISELLQEGQTFKDLFLPDPVELSDYSESEDEEPEPYGQRALSHKFSRDFSVARSEMSPTDRDRSRTGMRQSSILDAQLNASREPGREVSGDLTPVLEASEGHGTVLERPKRYGDRPTFWLDVLSPTDAEMKVLSRTFGLHMLTSEDILMQESREKVELFRHYYFIHYRTFEQDPTSENYMDPVNMYIVVFREGVITFHFSMTPHPANVRRRIRQLSDYLILNPDWLSYALIDDITDAYQPVIESIEERVDEIDDAILEMHGEPDSDDEDDGVSICLTHKDSIDEKGSIRSSSSKESPGTNMLRRVGRIRKKVMKLGRLLGTKADVIKGFAKRCNEQWDIAPRSDIGMFLGDIQDHILTMQSSLSHYEMLLSRAHSNYLAQISIRMNERQEETSGSLNKLTVLGTIVLPMNIITGMWGMNVKVPGQDIENLNWFACITAGLFMFGALCWIVAKRLRII